MNSISYYSWDDILRIFKNHWAYPMEKHVQSALIVLSLWTMIGAIYAYFTDKNRDSEKVTGLVGKW